MYYLVISKELGMPSKGLYPAGQTISKTFGIKSKMFLGMPGKNLKMSGKRLWMVSKKGLKTPGKG